MDDNPIADTSIALQLDEIPVIGSGSRAIVRDFAHPDGTAGRGPGVIWSGSGERLAFGEDMAEKGFHDGHAAADESGVDFDHTRKQNMNQSKSGIGEDGKAGRDLR